MSSPKKKSSRPEDFSGKPSGGYYPQGPVPLIDPTRQEVKPFKPRTELQAQVFEALHQNALTFLLGPAGAAKTFLACALAVKLLKEGKIKKIVCARPAVEAGDSIGFLKGDKDEKMGPYVQPMLDNLAYFYGSPAVVDALRKQGIIEITPLTFLRGRSFHDTVVILDEMQNATPAQLKLCLTRAGENCKMIVTADPGQCDLPDDMPSATVDMDVFRGEDDIAYFNFDIKDVVRSALVKRVLKVYERLEAA